MLETNEIVLIGVLFLLLVGFGFFLDRLTRALVEQGRTLADLLPPWAIDMIELGGNRAIEEGTRLVERTPNRADDELLALFERRFDEMLAELRGIRTAEPPAEDEAA